MADRPQPLTVLHIINDLDSGGAETMMGRIVERSDAALFRHVIVSLTTLGPIGTVLRSKGFDVSALGLSRYFPNPIVIWRLRRLISRMRPDVVKSWMYHANLVAGIVVSSRIPVVWGIHNLSLAPAMTKWTLRMAAQMGAILSRRIPRRIVFDSHAAAEAHRRIGYDERVFAIVPNGFDTDLFTRDKALVSLRSELQLPADTPIIGLVARFNPAKDHRTFLEAAALIRRVVPEAHFVLCGGYGITEENETLMRWIDELSLRDAIHLLGRRDDLTAVMVSLDVGVSSSATESFPVVVGEMMASGVPCVVTDVGDTRVLTGDTAAVLPAGDAQGLAEACVALLRMPAEERRSLGRVARKRIVDHFSLAATVRAYEELLAEVATENAANSVMKTISTTLTD
jgi:glycosyltransferase involved in cell wall biosynthesis